MTKPTKPHHTGSEARARTAILAALGLGLVLLPLGNQARAHDEGELHQFMQAVGQSVSDIKGLLDNLQAQIDFLHLEPGPKTVFGTRELYNGNLGGLAGADAKCQAAADGSDSIVPSGTYLAWLSDSTGSPSTRFTQSSSPYVDTQGSEIAADYTDLTDGSISGTIDHDETGTRPLDDNQIWTNTGSDGTWPPDETEQPAASCNDWTSTAGVGRTGNTLNPSDGGWTDIESSRDCRATLPLYCFQQ